MLIKLEVLSPLGPCVCISWAYCSRFFFSSLSPTETGNSQLLWCFFFFSLCERLSRPQRPKPISRSSDGRGSFNSFPIGSEGEEIAPVGGWELEF